MFRHWSIFACSNITKNTAYILQQTNLLAACVVLLQYASLVVSHPKVRHCISNFYQAASECVSSFQFA